MKITRISFNYLRAQRIPQLAFQGPLTLGLLLRKILGTALRAPPTLPRSAQCIGKKNYLPPFNNQNAGGHIFLKKIPIKVKRTIFTSAIPKKSNN
jgi:hypothetical protein